MLSASPPSGPPRDSRRRKRPDRSGRRGGRRGASSSPAPGSAGAAAPPGWLSAGTAAPTPRASGRPGGHVRTIRDPLPDGLYADVGAEHFTRPRYDQCWKYVEKFGLPFVPYPRRIAMYRRIDGAWYTEAQLQDPKVLRAFGFN